MKHKHKRQSIGRKKAIELYDSEFWLEMSDREKTEFQLFTDELCMPMDVFHKAIEAALGRPVFTHELGLNYDGLVDEFLGKKPAPSFREVLELIPAEKRVIVVAV